LRVLGVGLVVGLGALVLASSAWAGGTWAYSSADHTQFQINFQTDNSQSAFFEVFTLSVPVLSATCPGGGAGSVGQPDNNPDEFECQISPAASSGAVTVTTGSSSAALEQCSAQIANKASFDNTTYTPQNPIMPLSGNCSPPVAAFSVSSGQTAGSPVSFDGSDSTDPNPGGGITGYSWDFGDGSSPATGAMVTHTYAQPGTYQVKLTVTDKEGGAASITHTITVASASGPKPPVASFTVSPSATMVGSAVSFDGSGSNDPNVGGSIVAYNWSFGDGTNGSGAKVTHTYTTPGTYTVTLTVLDAEDGTASTTHQVTVRAAKPVNTGLPQISGDALTGDKLTASTGTWTNNPTSFDYQWQRCGKNGGGCQDILAASDESFWGPTPDEINFTVRVVVTATNASGSTSATSQPTAVVEPPPLTVGSTSTNGSAVTLPVGCSAQQTAFNGNCLLLLLLAALGGGQPTAGHAPDLAIAASCHPTNHHHCPKVTVVGNMKVKIPAGHTKKVRIMLNRAGRRLLAKQHMLKVKLTITENGQTLFTRTIVFKAKPVKKKR
jgi:PKD repeat protein